MAKKYIVTLTEQERSELERMLSVGKAAARKLAHARVLLKADAGAHGPAFIDAQIAQACELSVRTVESIRQRFVELGFHAALERQKQVRPSRQKLLDGEKEAHLVAVCCGARPEGHARWTLRLLADRLVELEIVESISHETVRQCLKKMN
jgi:transposase